MIEDNILKSKIESWLKEYSDKDIILVEISINNTLYEVFVDTIQNITISQCSSLNRYLQAMIDEDDSFPEVYILEVSSPGATRALSMPFQYQKRIGLELNINTNENKDLNVIVKKVESDYIEVETLRPKTLKNKDSFVAEQIKLKYTEINKSIIPLKFK